MTEKLRLASRILFFLLAGSLAAWVLYSAGVGTAVLIRVHTVLLSAVAMTAACATNGRLPCALWQFVAALIGAGFAWAFAVILFYNWIVWAFSKPDLPRVQENIQCD